MPDKTQVRQLDIHFSPEATFSPFADPAITSAFANVAVAGLAAESLIAAVLRKVKPIVSAVGEVIEVTPQHTEKTPGQRGSRVDITVRTASLEIVIFEVQVIFDDTLPIRNLLGFSHRFSSSLPTGPISEATTPKIIAINLLCYDLPDDRIEYVQPEMLMYTIPPVKVSNDRLVIINIQLTRFLDNAPDFTEPLDCWLYTWYEAHKRGITPQEVIKMTPQLKAFETANPGFAQYAERFSNIAADEVLREQYYLWLNEQLRLYGEMEGAKRLAREENEENNNKLFAILLTERRYEDMERATKDPEFKNGLYLEYGIIQKSEVD